MLGSDYGGWGVVLVALFALSREMKNCRAVQVVGLAVICWMIGGYTLPVGAVRVPVEIFGLAALVPVFCYSGRKITKNVWIQWAFYLFYPVHLLVLLIIERSL